MTNVKSDMAAYIEGKVAAILSEREVAITVGARDGVKLGMRFKVVEPEGVPVSNPDTGEQLGVIQREKVRVEVTEVHERFSVCRTYRVKYVEGGALGGASSFARMLSEPVSIPETLKAKGSDYIPSLSEQESFVKKGDPVFQLQEESKTSKLP